MSNTHAVILAGGQGKRMKSDVPKALCSVLGTPMLEWVINACEKSSIHDLCIVTGFSGEKIEQYLNGRYPTVLQEERLGTGHAVMQAVNFLKERVDGDTLILCGDAPFIDEDTISKALKLHQENNNSVTVITAIIPDPSGYGRIVRDADGINGIVEQKDCNAEQLKITEINSGAFWFKTADLLEVLFDISPNNSQKEYYLTDAISLIIAKNKRANTFISSNQNVALGANDRRSLLNLNSIARMDIINKHLDNGVNFVCTDGVIIDKDVMIGIGTEISSGVHLRGITTIGEGCSIGPNCIISNCTVGSNTNLNYVQAYQSIIEDNVKIGPFVHIRPNSVIKSGVKIGDFVEIKNSEIGERTAVSHLTYIGDSEVGSNVNFGCGVVTANYDGTNKSKTIIKDNAFLGCNTILVAPVVVGIGAYTAAGTTVTKDVPDNALAIDRGEFRIKEGFSIRKLKSKNK